MHIGVLAIQGAFKSHCLMLERLGVQTSLVRTPQDLSRCAGLILPGGESTTMKQGIEKAPLLEPLLDFALSHPLFGTCAGMILLSTLGLLNITIERNAYGRQRDSFSTPLTIHLNEKSVQMPGIFIRAPQVTELHSPHIKVFATHKSTPILIQQDHYLAASFHPELTNEPAIHMYFIELCRKNQANRSQKQPSMGTSIKSSPTI